MLLKKENKFEDLGYMVDCSRGQVPTITSLKKLVDILSSFGYTYLMLYTEDTFELENEPYFGQMRGRYSQKEIKELDKYCQSKNIELRACIQTLAHLGRLLRHADYSHLFEIEDILFVGEPKTYDFIDRLFASLNKMFSCKKVHIGMDEAWKLGRGKYLDKYGKVSIQKIMQEHLEKVAEIAAKYGFECDIWADMLAHAYYSCEDKTQFSLSIPQNVTPIIWRYYPKGEQGTNQELEVYKKISNKLGYAGGAHRWTGFTPGNQFAFRSLGETIDGCLKYQIKRYLLTAWGDGAADASLFSTLPAIYYAALKCHGLDLNEETKKYFKKVIGMSFDQYLLIDKLNQIDPTIDYAKKYNCLSFTHLYNDTLQDLFNNYVKGNEYENYTNVVIELKKIKNKTYGYIFQSLAALGEVDALKACLGKDIYYAYQNNDLEGLKQCVNKNNLAIKALEHFMKVYEVQWLKENKSFGFEKQLIRLGGLKERMHYTSRVITNYIQGKIDHIDELEEKHLPSDYFYGFEVDIDSVDVSEYDALVSGGRMRNF